MSSLSQRFSKLLRARSGPMTEELRRSQAPQGLGQLPTRLQPETTTESVCGYCSTGCSLKVHLREGEAINLSADANYPVNLGMACPKGWEALKPLEAGDRAKMPLLRDAQGECHPVSWSEAAHVFAARMRDIQLKHGPDSVAWLGTGQIPTEELAFIGALAKFGMGFRHGDGNTRQCMATSVVAYKESFGFDAPPYTYADFEESDLIVLIGSNLAIAHPILWQRLMSNRVGGELVVIDPRRTETAQYAHDHFAIEPKSDLVFFYSLAHVLVREGWVDTDFVEAHTEGYADFAKHLETFTPERAERTSGIARERIEALAQRIHEAERASLWWTMGVNQSYEGVRVAQSIINLALMSGHIGRPGTGANSITGQCNAMGSRLFSNTTNLLGGRAFEKAEHRAEVADILQIPVERISQTPSLAYDQIMQGIEEGRIRGLWIIATNPAHSWIHQSKGRELLDKLDFLVVQDMYGSTETAQMADLMLPSAGWGEKEGTFINSERRIGRTRKVRQAPGEAISDFDICRKLAQAWGCADLFQRWDTPEHVFEILQQLSKGRPCDITGVRGYGQLEQEGGVQWPCPEGVDRPARERRLFEDGRFYHPDAKARFCFAEPSEQPEPTSEDYPLLLMTGRGTSAQWHTQTRTGKSAVLRKLYPRDGYIEIHPEDARARSLSEGAWAIVRSARGEARLRVQYSDILKPGQVFAPMHDATVNRLTFPAFDPYSRQPSYKACAVDISATNNP